MTRRWVMLLILAAAGCTRAATGARELKPVSPTPPRPVERVDAVDLWAVPPAAINWDDLPGPDGVQVQVFLYRAEQPQPVLVKGTLEFLMYAGRIPREDLAAAQPVRVWTFTAQELATRQIRSIPGWGYAVQLGWGRNVPAAPVVTVTVRYLPPSGPPLYALPISIAIPSPVRSGPTRTILGGEPGVKVPPRAPADGPAGGETAAPPPHP